MVGVVLEGEVGVRVVDRRVPAERVVVDVERVVRPRGDGRPASKAALKTVVETWQNAAAETGLELAVDDDGRLEEALRRVPLTGRLVEGERRVRSDHVPVDQARDELHVVDPVRVAP